MSYENLDKKLGQFLASQVPPGSGPEGYDAALHALADVLGMYLGGRLAKFGRKSYRKKGQDLMDRIAGVSEVTAVQLRPQGRPELVGMPKQDPTKFLSPPTDFDDSDGSKGILLSTLGALIATGEDTWWRLPGWPEAKIRMTTEGLEIVVEPDPQNDFEGSTWLVRQKEFEVKN